MKSKTRIVILVFCLLLVIYFIQTKKPNQSDNDYTIVDETEICAEALEEIARDETYIYFLPCIKSSTVFLKYNNGQKITIRDALDKNMVTIDELINKGLEVYRHELKDILLND